MWTKASVSATQEESMWSNWIYTLPPRGRERRGLNWAFCTMSIELEIETAKSKQCENMMWKTLQAEQAQLKMTQSSCVACSESHAEMAVEHTEWGQDSSSFPLQSGEIFHILKWVWRWGCCKGRLMRPPSTSIVESEWGSAPCPCSGSHRWLISGLCFCGQSDTF